MKKFRPTKNRGVILKSDPKLFAGGTLPWVLRNPEANWTQDVPTGEKQWGTGGDKMHCVTQSHHNCIETQLHFMIRTGQVPAGHIAWLQAKGYFDANGRINFSERFSSILNETTPDGNWLVKVADCAQEYGLIPASMLPEQIDLPWNQYYNRNVITPEMLALGKEFREFFDMPFEGADIWVWGTDKGRLVRELQHAPIQVVFPNHAVEAIFSPSVDVARYFDSYQPWIKDIARQNLTSAIKILINPKIRRMSNSRIAVHVKPDGAKEFGFFDPDISEQSFESSALNRGQVLPKLSTGKLDFAAIEKMAIVFRPAAGGKPAVTKKVAKKIKKGK